MNSAKWKDTTLVPRNQLYFYMLITKKKIKKTIPFTIASKRIKYLGINLTKDVKRPILKKLSDTKERNSRRYK